jgi:hypothetical protein
VILPVYDFRSNEWYKQISLANINGVFGMSYFPDYIDMNSFWFNMIAQGYNTTVAFSLIPTESDYSWIPNQADCSNTSNTLMIGDYNRTEYIKPGSNGSLTVQSAFANVWIFDVTMDWGLLNTTNSSAIT